MSTQEEPISEPTAERRVAKGFAVTVVAALALGVVYMRGGQPQLEGIFLAVALGGLGYGFAVWAERLLPQGPVEQEREPLSSTEEEREAFVDDLERQGLIGRRKLLTRMLGLAGLALGFAALFPIRSLGPGPGQKLEKTSWKKGTSLVDEKGRVVKVDAVPVGGTLTVFPEGHEEMTEKVDSQVVLIKVEEGFLEGERGGEDWAPQGLIAFSKVCTHAGCPVGLYQADTHQLICPCHQSAFNVLDGARPVFGPATRPLPQLPIEVDHEGVLKAKGDFDEPIGPAYWNRPR
jgi:ubiquinol-cytochrome c reductase iron-sulfur subunit